jgi:hypothetical protein
VGRLLFGMGLMGSPSERRKYDNERCATGYGALSVTMKCLCRGLLEMMSRESRDGERAGNSRGWGYRAAVTVAGFLLKSLSRDNLRWGYKSRRRMEIAAFAVGPGSGRHYTGSADLSLRGASFSIRCLAGRTRLVRYSTVALRVTEPDGPSLYDSLVRGLARRVCE